MEALESVTGTAEEEQIPQDTLEEQDSVEEHELTDEEVDVFVDPGQLEGLSDEQKKEHEPPPDHPRFKEVYGKYKENERKVESLTKELEDIKKRLEAQPAQQVIQPQQPIQAPQVEEQAPKPEEKISALKESLIRLKAERTQAFKDFDGDKVAQIEDEIDKIKDDIISAKLESQQKNQADISKEIEKERIKLSAQNFAKRNEWFSQNRPDGSTNPDFDPIKYGAARSLETYLLPTWQGSYDELLTEIENRINTRFNGNTNQQPKPKVSALQRAGSTTKPSASKSTRTLTALERKVAYGVFPNSTNPEKEYLNLIISQERGEQ